MTWPPCRRLVSPCCSELYNKCKQNAVNRKKRLDFSVDSVIIVYMNNQKTFSDLDFNDHANVSGGVQAKLELENDLEVSVVSMKGKHEGYGGLYGNVEEGTYEVAVFHHGNMLPLNATDDVRGWQSEDDLNALLDSLQGDGHKDFIAELFNAKNEWQKELDS